MNNSSGTVDLVENGNVLCTSDSEKDEFL